MQRSIARKIRHLRCKDKGMRTTIISIKTPAGGVQDITDKECIEEAIINNNVAKFQQTHHRPFYKKPLNQEFGYKGISTASAATLAGSYDTTLDIPFHEKLLLKALYKPQEVLNMVNIPAEIPLDSYRKFWLHAKENTCSYPDALSFSTMKAGAMSDIISCIECSLTSIPLLSGYGPQRLMIFKKSIIMELGSLRTIVLFPVDFNYAFKHVGRKIMHHAEKAKALALEQYGSRKRHKATDLALNKTLTYDILRQLKRPGSVCSNDAKSCYKQ